jgi:hypothetical protein
LRQKFLFPFEISSDYFNEFVKKPMGLVRSIDDLFGDVLEAF